MTANSLDSQLSGVKHEMATCRAVGVDAITENMRLKREQDDAATTTQNLTSVRKSKC
jgi:hypothetical protein